MTPRLDMIGVVVADMGKAVAFYQRLGLEFTELGGGHFEATLPGGIRLALDTEDVIRSFNPSWSRGRGGRTDLAFLLPDATAVDALYAELVADGAETEVEPFDAFWGQRYAVVLDPDGNGVDLFAPLATS